MSATETDKLRIRELKRRALESLDALREEVRRQQPNLSAEEAYRIAGFSEEVIRQTLEYDQKLAERAASKAKSSAERP